MKACTPARAAPAELKTAVELIANPAILINPLPILEARARSEIENIRQTTDELFRFAVNESAAADTATKEALRYGIAQRQTASAYLATLAGFGIVAPVQAGREKLFVNTDLLELLKVESHPRR